MDQVVIWKIQLQGEEFDLEDFPEWLYGCDVAITRRENGFALSIPARVVGVGHSEVRQYANNLIEYLNGIGRLLNSSFRPIALSSTIHGLNAEGRIVSTAAQLSGVELREKAGSIGVLLNGVPQPDPKQGLARPLLCAALQSQRASDALTILGRSSLTWAELYLLFEIVEGDVGSLMHALNWITKTEAQLFCRTANSYSALRSEARHGKDNQLPPRNPMSKNQATGLIRKLVQAWLRHLDSRRAAPIPDSRMP